MTTPPLGEFQPLPLASSSIEQADDAPATEPQRLTAPQVLAVIAAVATVALTAVAFWLSYAHLHDGAHDNGLAGDPARAWAWPATIDLFIVIGEVLILRATLRGRTDPWAIALAASGSLGSIALNVTLVGAGRDAMVYIVAGTPPVAALLAFGALMRQLHEVLAARAGARETAAVTLDDLAVEALTEDEASAAEALTETPGGRAQEPQDECVVSADGERPQKRSPECPDERPRERRERAQKKPKKSATKTLTGRRRERARALYDDLGRRPEWTEIRDALVADKLADKKVSRATCQRVRDAIERDEPALAALGTDNVRAITS